MTTETRLYTGEEAARYATTERWALVRGRIVPLAPAVDEHGFESSDVSGVIREFVRPRKLGRVGVDIGFYTENDPDTLRGPDVLFISFERLGERPLRKFLRAIPELVVEIRSQNDSWRELHDKAREILRAGVDRVWLIDPIRRRGRVYRAETDFDDIPADGSMIGDGILDGLVIPLAAIFDA